MTRKALGRGLRALIPEAAQQDETAVSSGAGSTVAGEPEGEQASAPPGSPLTQEPIRTRLRETLKYLPIDAIRPNPGQPRGDWDPAALVELTDSIREKGLLEPIIVRPAAGGFELVAGERRLRACRQAGWSEIPAIVRSFDEHESLEAALIENIQRSDLNPVEEARGYQTLLSKYGMTHEDIAKRVGKNRSTVTNFLRILRLPEPVLDHVSRGTLSMGHVKVLLGLTPEQAVEASGHVIAQGWSVRQVEEWAAAQAAVSGRRRRGRRAARGLPKSDHIQRVEQSLCRAFATESRIRFSRKGGRIEIAFHDEEDLSRLLELLGIVVI
jgi:ParB family chromosome partitioning protein